MRLVRLVGLAVDCFKNTLANHQPGKAGAVVPLSRLFSFFVPKQDGNNTRVESSRDSLPGEIGSRKRGLEVDSRTL